MNKKIIYIDMDEVLADFYKSYLHKININPAIKFPQAEYGFFANLDPIIDSIESVKKLIDCELFDVYILTAPSVHNPLCYTEKRVWIEKYFGIEFCEKLIISPNKGLNKGDYLIDDNIEGKGQDKFEGELIHFGSKKFPNWKSVISFFNNKYKINI
jgi:5'-nucleotidase